MYSSHFTGYFLYSLSHYHLHPPHTHFQTSHTHYILLPLTSTLLTLTPPFSLSLPNLPTHHTAPPTPHLSPSAQTHCQQYTYHIMLAALTQGAASNTQLALVVTCVRTRSYLTHTSPLIETLQVYKMETGGWSRPKHCLMISTNMHSTVGGLQILETCSHAK